MNQPARHRRLVQLLRVLTLGALLVGALAPLATGAQPAPADDPVERVDAGGAPPPGSGPLDISTFARAVDGATLEAWYDNNRIGVGIIGIDVPQGNTICGAAATDFLQNLVYGGLHLDEDPVITYGPQSVRMYYVSTPDGSSLAAALVAAGFATASQQGAEAAQLAELEAQARAAGRGCLWGDPSEYSRGSAQAESARAPQALEGFLPTGFTMSTVVGNLNFPTTFAFLPDGRILIGEKSGVIWLFDGEAVLPEPFLDLSDQVNDYWDRGLLDIAVDPNFASNGYVYLLYTYEHDPDNYDGTKTGRLLRVTATGDAAMPNSEFVVLGSQVGDSCEDFPIGADCIPSDSPGHSTGGLAFAPDGNLFVTLGDGSNFNTVDPLALRAQQLDLLSGKLLRISATGQGLPDNPFYTGAPGGNRSKVWAYGLRNAYRFTVQPDTGVPHLGDVGWTAWEELDIAQPGANFGWPCYEGPARQGGYESFGVCQTLYVNDLDTGPFVTWGHAGFSTAATGGVFYTGSSYPAEYQGAYFYGDYGQGFIRYLTLDANGNLEPEPNEFLADAAGPVKFVIGPSGDIYYLSINSGQIRRLQYTNAGPADEVYLSELAFSFDENGWGPVERDMSNGGDGSGDGGPITLNGVVYSRGLGVHAVSDVRVLVDGACQLFSAEIGVDDEVGPQGSVTFEVWGDGELLYESDTLTGLSETEALALNISGVDELRLVVTDGGDGFDLDHADWAMARLGCSNDEQAPQVLSAAPEDGAVDVAVNTTLSLALDEPLDVASLAGNVTLAVAGGGASVPLDVTFDNATNVLEVTLDERLTISTVYQLTLRGGPGGVTDLIGNPLAADYVTSFTTAAVGAPVATITSPTDGQLFAVGDVIAFAGTAVDGSGTPLPDSAFSWEIVIQHCEPQDCHLHQLLSLAETSSGDFIIPDHGGDYYFEIRLEVTDQLGFSDATSVAIRPRTVNVTLDTEPAGLAVVLAGETGTGAMTREIVVGSTVTLSTPSPQGVYEFTGWSDGGAQLHDVVIGASDVTYTVTFDATAQTLYVSDLPWLSEMNGWGPAERDRSNGEQGASDGGPLVIQGVSYSKGIGVHAFSRIELAVPAGCTVFQAAVGLDDEVSAAAAGVRFEVWVDGVRQYQSGVLGAAQAASAVSVPVAGAGVVGLVVETLGSDAWDHADWGDAKLLCGTGEPPVDETPPTVSTTMPANGATLVPSTGPLQVTFSEAMNQAATEAAFGLTPPVAGSFSWNAAGTVMTFTPDAELAADQLYSASISTVATDLAGNTLAGDYSWSFTTVAAGSGESVVRLNAGGPAFSGATGVWSADTGFSGGAGYVTSGAVANTTDDGLYQSERYGTFSYSFALPNGDYQVTLKFAEIYWTSVGQRVFDVRINGQLVLDNFDILAETSRFSALDKLFPVSVTNGTLAISFVTVTDNAKVSAIEVMGVPSGPDTTPPTVTTVTPTAGAASVPLNVTPQATFSEALNPATVIGNAVLRVTGGASVTAAANYDAATRSILLMPAAALDPETSYTVELTGGSGGITDVAGNALASDYNWSFTTVVAGTSETLYLSDLPWLSETNGWGPAERDRSNGEQGSNDGRPMLIQGVGYAKGIGAHAASSIEVAVPATCTVFLAAVGVDDEVPNGDTASLRFEVWVDGVRQYQGGTLGSTSAAVLVEAPVAGAGVVRLVVDPLGSNGWDHADWGEARFLCGGAEPPADETPPTVTTVSPLSGATNVALNATPQATFNEALNPATVTGNAVLRVTGGAALAATANYDAATRAVRITPAAALAAATSYTVELNGGTGGLADVAGNALASDYSWSFTTVAATGAETLYLSDLAWLSETNGWGPAERDRSNGEQGASDGGPLLIQGVSYPKGIGVHAFSRIEVAIPVGCTVFQAAVGIDDEVTAAAASVGYEVWVDGVRQYQSAPLGASNAAVLVDVPVAGAGVVQLVVETLGSDAWDHADWGDAKFLCDGGEPPVDETPPTVTTTLPADGSGNVAVDVVPEVTFNEPLDPDTLVGNVVLRETGGAAVDATVSYDAVRRTVTLTPDAEFVPSRSYTVELQGGAGGLADVAGNALAGDYSWSFTTGQAALRFAAPASFAAGVNAHSATVADLNGDQNLDVVVANAESDSVSVLLGNGQGGFAAGVSYPVGDKPKYAALADMDGDTELDLVVANEQSSNVSVLLGNGDGTFTALGVYLACTHPHHLTVADLDDDQALDVVTVCTSGQGVRVLLGNGDGSLQALETVVFGGTPHSVAAVDLDEDGVLDLAVAGHSQDTVYVLLGHGDGTFAAPLSNGVGARPHSIAFADLDDDGNVDLVTANENSNNVSVLFGNGDGTFQPHVTFAVGSVPKTVTVGDLNGDGWLDIVTANSAGNYPNGSNPTNVSVLLNDGAGGFAPASQHPTGLTPFGLALGDFNEDGLLDIVTANWHTNDLTLLLQE